MMSSKLITICFFVLIIEQVSGQNINSGAIVEAYKNAMKSLTSIEYELSGYGINSGDSSWIKGIVTYKEGTDYDQNRFHFHGETGQNGFIRQLEFSDNNEHYFIRESDNTIRTFKNVSQALLKIGLKPSHHVFNGPFSSAPQYGYISNESKVEFISHEVVEGVECIKLKVTGKSSSTINMFIGREDHLLRRLEHQKYVLNYNIKRLNYNLSDEVFDLSKKYSQEVVRAEVLEVNSEAPSFSLKDLTGLNVALKEFEGKIVVIDFWGTWCKPCLKQIPELNEMFYSLSKQNIIFLSISCFDKTKDDVMRIVETNGIEYPVLLNGDEISRLYGVITFPTLIVIDKVGKILLTKGSGGTHDNSSLAAITDIIISKRNE